MKPADITAGLRMASTVILCCLMSASCDAPPSVSDSTEPYQVKFGDELGVRLGMSWDDFVKQVKEKSKLFDGNPTDACAKSVDYDDIHCSISVDSQKAPSIGNLRIDFLTLSFYQKKLIQVRYRLVGFDHQVVVETLKEKYGTTTCNSDTGCEWRNRVSTLRFQTNSNDQSSSNLELTLTNEMNAYVERIRNKAKAAAKDAL